MNLSSYRIRISVKRISRVWVILLHCSPKFMIHLSIDHERHPFFPLSSTCGQMLESWPILVANRDRIGDFICISFFFFFNYFCYWPFFTYDCWLPVFFCESSVAFDYLLLGSLSCLYSFARKSCKCLPFCEAYLWSQWNVLWNWQDYQALEFKWSGAGGLARRASSEPWIIRKHPAPPEAPWLIQPSSPRSNGRGVTGKPAKRHNIRKTFCK